MNQSTAIADVIYDPESGDLTIVFHARGTYLYKNVPALEASALIEAGSLGEYFNRNIRDNYEYYRIG